MDAAALGTKFKMSVTPAVTESNCSGDSSTLANAGVARPKHMVAAASKFRTYQFSNVGSQRHQRDQRGCPPPLAEPASSYFLELSEEAVAEFPAEAT
jgi:hypothetical protein